MPALINGWHYVVTTNGAVHALEPDGALQLLPAYILANGEESKGVAELPPQVCWQLRAQWMMEHDWGLIWTPWKWSVLAPGKSRPVIDHWESIERHRFPLPIYGVLHGLRAGAGPDDPKNPAGGSL